MKTIIIFSLIILIETGCKKSNKDIDPYEKYHLDDLYIKARVGGDTISLIYKVDECMFGSGTVHLNPYDRDASRFTSKQNESFSVSIYYPHGQYNRETFHNQFKLGNYAFKPYESYSDGQKLVEVSWVDQMGIEWKSVLPDAKKNMPDSQANSVFKITEEVKLEDGIRPASHLILADIHCHLYNSNGESIMISNGKLRANFYVIGY